MTIELSFIVGTVALILGVMAMVIGIIAMIELRSFNKSTHQVQFQPMPGAMNEKELNDFLEKEHEDLEYDQL